MWEVEFSSVALQDLGLVDYSVGAEVVGRDCACWMEWWMKMEMEIYMGMGDGIVRV